MSKKAVILVSGGLDSLTCLAIAKAEGYDCYALSFDYGQRHDAELNAAKEIIKYYQIKEHKIIRLSLNDFCSSALINNELPIPDNQVMKNNNIPVTYVPARNTIFLSIALGYAEVISAQTIIIGVSAIDYSGYPDCRPDYIQAFERMANLATKAAIEGKKIYIYTPLIHLSKAETIQKGVALDVDYSLAVSCYQADKYGKACGRCESCSLRKKGFEQAQIVDPTRYC